jgi:hypothetical protein
MVRVIKHAEAHYEVKDVAFGKAYRWRPERIIIECVCGRGQLSLLPLPPAMGAARTMQLSFGESYSPGRQMMRPTRDEPLPSKPSP